MRRLLHLLKTPVPDQALAAIERESRAPDTALTVVLTHGAPAPTLPPGVSVKRLTEHLTYSGLLDLIFAADQVISW